MREHIRQGMAELLWGDAWASHIEVDRDQNPNRKPCFNLSGCEITDVMPKIPDMAFELTDMLIAKYETANGCSIEVLLKKAAMADDGPITSFYAERFGVDLAYMALGHGISWFDDHAKFDLKQVDFYIIDLQEYAIETCLECNGDEE